MNAAPRPVQALFSEEIGKTQLLRLFQGLELRVFRARECPALMDELGRVRELAFRQVGGGTGKDRDIDSHDRGPQGFYQLVAWDPQQREIVSAYRYWPGWEPREEASPMASLFEWSQDFREGYWPRTLELGRSLVNPQARKKLGGLFAIWAGLGALIARTPSLEYLFGKVTVYPTMPPEARNLLHSLLVLLYPGKEGLLLPRKEWAQEIQDWSELGLEPPGEEEDRFAWMDLRVREAGGQIPSLFHSYLNLSSRPQFYGTVLNGNFGSVYETALLLPVSSISPKRREQFIDSYVNPEAPA